MAARYSRSVDLRNHNHTYRVDLLLRAHPVRMAKSPAASAAQREMGARLKLIREAKHLTQEALGEVMGVGETTISGWESGRNQIDLFSLAKAADFLGFTTDFIARDDWSGLPFDLAQKLQRMVVANAGSPRGRGRPRKNLAQKTPHPDQPPALRDASAPGLSRQRRTLHQDQEEYIPPPKPNFR